MIFDTNWSKNTNDTCVTLAQRMLDAKMMRRFTAAVQSMNPDTLKAIKRVNLDGAQLDNVAYTAKERGVSVSTELIIGLPEETYDTWRAGVIKLMKDNFIIEAYPLSMLPNSHLSNPAYMKQYGLKTKTIKTKTFRFQGRISLNLARLPPGIAGAAEVRPAAHGGDGPPSIMLLPPTVAPTPRSSCRRCSWNGRCRRARRAKW